MLHCTWAAPSNPHLRPLHTNSSVHNKLICPPRPQPQALSSLRVLRLRERQGHHQAKPTFIPSSSSRLTAPLLLLLSRFSRVQLCATPETAAHQAPLSLGFSRQEHWSGLPFPSPMRESEITQSCPTPSDPMDCSLPGSLVHGIFQARVLEWVAIAFSHNPSANHKILSPPSKAFLGVPFYAH